MRRIAFRDGLSAFRNGLRASPIPKTENPKLKTFGLIARGFTLIELLVVLAIIVIISLIIFTSANKFNSAILLRSLAYEIGLSVREAQLYGVAVHVTPGSDVTASCAVGGPSQFCASYGVHFDTTSDTNFFIFADVDENGVYDSPTDIKGDSFAAQYGFTISDLCVASANTTYCSAAVCPTGQQLSDDGLAGSCTPNSLHTLDITFVRPNPDANILPVGSGIPLITDSTATGYTAALITVLTPGGDTRSISVSQTGQIAITGQ